MSIILTASLSLAGLGLLLGLGLVLAGKYLSVEIDPRIEQIADMLPNANCGACGFAGCSGFAKALVAGTAEVTDCTPGGSETAAKIAAILGVEAGDVVETIAVVRCAGGDTAATRKSIYAGISNCQAAELVAGGDKLCPYGCLGLGSCQVACPFGAVVITEDRLAVIDAEKCTGCGKCVDACPRSIINLVPKSRQVHVLCRSLDKSKAVKAYCTVGCIACKLCAKQSKAFDVSGGLSVLADDFDGEIPETAQLVCAPGTIVDLRDYQLMPFLSEAKVREGLKDRQKTYKAEQKRLKEEKKKKKEAATAAKAEKEAAEKAKAEEAAPAVEAEPAAEAEKVSAKGPSDEKEGEK